MITMSQEVPSKLLWIDLEMTGLDPDKDVVIEVAAIITDWDFRELDSYQRLVKGDPDQTRELLDNNPWWSQQSGAKEQILSEIDKGENPSVIEKELISLIDKHAENDVVLLSGNSIHQDRRFIRRLWPELESRLHYRMLDVSSWKVVMIGKYQNTYEKSSTHRAMDDIKESIEELKSYLGYIKY